MGGGYWSKQTGRTEKQKEVIQSLARAADAAMLGGNEKRGRKKLHRGKSSRGTP